MTPLELRKYADLFKAHVEFLGDLQIEDEDKAQHVEEMFDALSQLLELMENSEEGEDGADLEKLLEEKEKEIEELRSRLEELEGSKGEAPSGEIEEKLKEYEEKVASLQKRIDELEKELEAAAGQAEEGEQEEEEEEPERPTDPRDVEGWAAWLEANPDDEEALQSFLKIENLAKIDENKRLLADFYLTRYHLGLFDSEEEALQLLQKAADLYEELGATDELFGVLFERYTLLPNDAEAKEKIHSLVAEEGLWEEYASLLLQTSEETEDEDLMLALALEAARIYGERLGDLDKGIEILNDLLRRSDAPEILDELASLYKDKEDWENLIDVLERRMAHPATEEREKVYYLKEMADVQLHRRGEALVAAGLYEEALSLVPDDMEVLDILERIYEEQELYDRLASVLQRKVETTSEPEVARQARRKLGFLYANKLDDPVKAIDVFEHLLEVMEDDLEMMRELARLYEQTGRMRAYVRLIERIANITEDEEEKETLYKRLATEWEMHPSTRLKAAQALENILAFRPDAFDVYERLEQIYEDEEEWEDLARLLERHAEALDDDHAKAKYLAKLAEVRWHKLRDFEGAAEAMARAHELHPDSLDIMRRALAVFEKAERYEDVVAMVDRLLEDTEDNAEKAALLTAKARALLALGERTASEEAFHAALELKDDLYPALKGLGDLYYEEGQWSRAVGYYEKALDKAENKLEKLEMMSRMAKVYYEELDFEDKAVQLYERIIEEEPGHPLAVEALSSHYRKTGQWEKAAPLYHIRVSEARDLPKEERVRLLLDAARVALKVNDLDKAAAYLEQARELDATSLEVLLELGELRFKREEWDGALSLYQALLVAHRDALSTDEVARIYCNLGIIKEKKGDVLKAISFYEKALEADPGNEIASEAIIRLKEETQEYEKVAEIKWQKIEAEQDIERKLELIGDLVRFYIEKVKDLDKAVEIQEYALSLRPDDRMLLNEALDLYHMAERWEKVVEIILKLGEMEDLPALKAKYHYSAGLIYDEELGDYDAAMAEYEKCLDLDPQEEDAFARIKRILTEREDWRELARAIRRQLKRRPDAIENPQLWDELGRIYEEKLGDVETALAAYEAAAKLDPSPERNSRLAEMYISAGPDHLDKAAEYLHKVLDHEPEDEETLRKLLDIYIAMRDKDAAWILSAALTMYGFASDKERKYYELKVPGELPKASGVMTDDMWETLLKSPEESTHLNKILAGLGHHLSLFYARPHKDYGISRKQRLNLDKEEHPFVKAYNYVTRLLLIETRPELYLKEGLPIPIQLANTRDGDSLVLSWFLEKSKFESMDEWEAAYYFSRELPFLRPERLFRRAAPAPQDLYDSLYAAFLVLMGRGDAPEPPEDRVKVVEDLAKHIQMKVPAAVLESLKPLARRFLHHREDFLPEVNRWILANHKTSIRSAVLVTGEPRRAIAHIVHEEDRLTGMKAKARVKEAMRFLLSKEHLQLRKKLGLTVE